MPNFLLVMIGGAAGAGLRYEVGRLSLRLIGPGFPWGTLGVNLLGGLAMGVVAGLAVRNGPNEPLHLLFGVGLLGGFTTFSAFSLESFAMLQRGEFATMLSYAAVSVIGSIALLAAAYTLTKLLA
jgi:CrcB protein